MSIDDLKRAAAYRAVDFTRSGMVIGLGSGSTASYATKRIGEKLRTGELGDIVGVPTSEETARLARGEGIPLTTLEDYPQIDVTIDGADEVDPDLNLIKGGGGFLLREKIVAYATTLEIIVVDQSKMVEHLGESVPLPVEVAQFGWKNTESALARTGALTKLRMHDGQAKITDGGNYIVDCRYGRIDDPIELANRLKSIPGVVEHGLFLGMANLVVMASSDTINILER
ncbi:MAG: ribose 5-phosphate isomerase A [Chloroflexi bacterium RBG_13_56_8]|nr:MAG: ribose 5-phosphate isomerase A [Chloroflexi bacterium RBG_13_56_8]